MANETLDELAQKCRNEKLLFHRFSRSSFNILNSASTQFNTFDSKISTLNTVQGISLIILVLSSYFFVDYTICQYQLYLHLNQLK